MSQEAKKYNLFANGSMWLKADFHRYTKADKEFKYTGEDAFNKRKEIYQIWKPQNS